MKQTGVNRPVDELGRVVIPKELRTLLDIEPGDGLEIFTSGKSIILRKYQQTCVFCRSNNGLTSFREKLICSGCMDGLCELAREAEYTCKPTLNQTLAARVASGVTAEQKRSVRNAAQ